MQLKAIDVAIGMAFLYLLLTFLASAVVELVSNIRNWRSQILYFALEKMLEGNSAVDVKLFYDHLLFKHLPPTKAAVLGWTYWSAGAGSRQAEPRAPWPTFRRRSFLAWCWSSSDARIPGGPH